MKHRVWLRLSLCLVASLLLIEGRAQTMQREVDKADVVQKIMARQFELRPAVREQNRTFCQSFLEDFKLQRNVQFIEPVVRADSYDDPAWQQYRSRCPNVGLFDSYHCEPKIAQSIERLPEKERDARYKSSCRHYRGTMKFKHFVVDINDNAKDGAEHVFYHERAQGPLNRPDATLNFANGGYRVVDLDSCELKGAVGTNDPYSYFYNRPLGNFNGIIRYHKKHYFFDLAEVVGRDSDPQRPQYNLRLHGHSVGPGKANLRPGLICSYSTS